MCARQLASAGHQVVVLDRERAPGGRLSARGAPGHTADHGAQFFTARDRMFRAHVAAWHNAGVIAPWEGRLLRFAVDGEPGGANPDVRWVGTPHQGALAAHLAIGIDMRTGIEIRHLDRQQGAWRLRDAAGAEVGQFDAVVLAMPAPQAAALLSDAPALQAAAQGVTMAPCWAVVAEYPVSLQAPFDGAFVERGPLSWVARDSSKPGRPPGERWVLHASSQWSRRYLEEAPGSVTRALLLAFARLLPGSEVASPMTHAHRWRYALPERMHPEPFLWDAALRVGACGDWCAGPRVEGAWLSGTALALRLTG